MTTTIILSQDATEEQAVDLAMELSLCNTGIVGALFNIDTDSLYILVGMSSIATHDLSLLFFQGGEIV